MVRALVLSPDAVRIDVREKDRTVFFALYVDPSDRGRVIGKQAKTLQALRLLFQAIATIHERNSFIEIKEEDSESPALAIGCRTLCKDPRLRQPRAPRPPPHLRRALRQGGGLLEQIKLLLDDASIQPPNDTSGPSNPLYAVNDAIGQDMS